MTGVPPSFPDDGQVFEGSREERFLALAVETLVHDMSPVGDGEVAKGLGAYTLGEGPPPDGVPEYVELGDGHLSLSNPPFLMAEIDVRANGGYALDIGFDSDLKLLIDPPVEVTIEGDFGEVIGTLEQMIAEIYRTKGRRLEMIDSGAVGPEEFAERR